MSGGGVQLGFGAELPVDPEAAAKLSTPERGALWAELGLDRLQIAAVEEAVQRVLRGEYGRKFGGRRGT